MTEVPELFAVWARKRKVSTKTINVVLDGYAAHHVSSDKELNCAPQEMTWMNYLASTVTVGDIMGTDIEEIKKYPGLGLKGMNELIEAVKMPEPKTVTLWDLANE